MKDKHEESGKYLLLLEKYAKLIPLAYLFLIAFSAFGQLFFFKYFEFPIFSFHSLEDILLLSFEDIADTIFAIIVFYVLAFVLEFTARILSFLIQIIINIYRVFILKAENKDYEFASEWRLTDQGISLALAVVTGLLINEKPVSVLVLWVAVGFNTLLLINVFLRVLLSRPLALKGKILTLFIILFQFQALKETALAQQIHSKGGKSISIDFSKKTISSDSTYIYLGNNSEYFFFLDKEQGTVDVIPSKDAQKISISTSRK